MPALVVVWMALLAIQILNSIVGRGILERHYVQRVADISSRVGATMPEDAFLAGRSRIVMANGIDAAVAIPIRIVGIAAVCALGMRLLGATLSLSQSTLLCAFGAVPSVVAEIVTLVQLIVLDTSGLNSFTALAISPARLASSQMWPPLVQLAAAHCTLPVVWGLGILGVGLREYSDLRRFETLGFLVALWVVSLIPGIVAFYWSI